MSEENKEAYEVGIPLDELPPDEASTDAGSGEALPDNTPDAPDEPSLLPDLFEPDELVAAGLTAELVDADEDREEDENNLLDDSEPSLPPENTSDIPAQDMTAAHLDTDDEAFNASHTTRGHDGDLETLPETIPIADTIENTTETNAAMPFAEEGDDDEALNASHTTCGRDGDLDTLPETIPIADTIESTTETDTATPFAEEDDTEIPTWAMAPDSEAPVDDDVLDQNLLSDRLTSLSLQITELQREFVGKLKYDAHKDEIIDRLHAELQEYKQNILKKYVLSIVMDIVKVADDIRKWLAYFRSLEVSQRDPRKLFRYVEGIPSDLEDVFYWHGVKPFSNQEGPFDPIRQRAIKKVPTSDPTLDKSVAYSIRPGYEWETKVVRQEMVAVYVNQDARESTNTGMIDE